MDTVLSGDKHFTASAYILTTEPEPRILLAYHRKLQAWMQPGGHIERNENPIEALIREVAEEAGIDISDHVGKHEEKGDGVTTVPLPNFIEEQPIPAHADKPAHVHLDMGYVFRIPAQDLRPAEGESEQIGWFTLSELAALPMLDNVRATTSKLLQKVGAS
jgi:8-oxo-dGTP pyrophosphatase MutT (NUDIX family)